MTFPFVFPNTVFEWRLVKHYSPPKLRWSICVWCELSIRRDWQKLWLTWKSWLLISLRSQGLSSSNVESNELQCCFTVWGYSVAGALVLLNKCVSASYCGRVTLATKFWAGFKTRHPKTDYLEKETRVFRTPIIANDHSREYDERHKDGIR